MSEYAPEPWTYGAKLSGSENHKGFVLYDSAGHWLADISPRDEDGKEGEAHARLMVAAPKLLRALESIVETCEAYGSRYYGGGTAAQWLFEIGNQAAAALLEARSERQETEARGEEGVVRLARRG